MYFHRNGMINGVGNAYRMIITSICFLCYGLFRLYIPVIKKNAVKLPVWIEQVDLLVTSEVYKKWY